MAKPPSHFNKFTWHRRRGSAAIEFALIFPLFFAILYATVSYALVMLLQMGISNAASDGARAAIQLIDPLQYKPNTFKTATEQRVTQAIKASLSWLAPAQVETIAANVLVDFSTDPGDGGGSRDGIRINVKVQWLGYASAPLLPSIQLPLVGQVPALPQNITGSASMLLR